MKNFVVVLAILATLIISGLFFSPSKNEAPRPIVFFGDSITAGVGTEAGKDFPSLLKTRLNTEVINAGVAGDTTESALRRLESDVLSKNPSLVVVELGGNDFLSGVPSETTENNLSIMLEKVKSVGAKVIVLGIKTGMFLDDIYLSMGARLAEKHGIVFETGVFAGVFGNQSLMSDLVHPNSAGHEVIAERLEKILN